MHEQFVLEFHFSSHILMEFLPYSLNENVLFYIPYAVEKIHLTSLNIDNPKDSNVANDKFFHLTSKFLCHNRLQNHGEPKNQTVLRYDQFADNNSLALFPVRLFPYMLQHVKSVLVSYFSLLLEHCICHMHLIIIK